MSSPPPGAEHDRVAGDVGWANELQQLQAPSPGEPRQEPSWDTVKRVLVSPYAAMVDLGRDVDVVRKGVIVALAYAITAAAVSWVQAALGYPPGTTVLDGLGLAWLVAGVPLSLLGTVLAAYVLRLAIPSHLDRRVGPAFGRLSLSWGVPGFAILWLGVVEVVLLATGLIDPGSLRRLYEDGIWLGLLSMLLSLWPVLVTAVAIRVATERNWLVVLMLLLLTTIVAVQPAVLPLLLL